MITKIKHFTSITRILVLLAAGVTSLPAHAAAMAGSLGTASYAADAWNFVCGTGTTKVQVRVTDGRNPVNTLASVYASFAEDGNPTLTTVDTESTTLPSPWVINTSDGPGTYLLIARKTGAGMEDYVAEAVCLNSLGATIGPTSFKNIHNQ